MVRCSMASCSKYYPSPLFLALTLTAVSFVVSVLSYESGGLLETGVSWIKGATKASGAAFTLKMAIILICGHVIATSECARKLIAIVAKLPKGRVSASMIVAMVACVTSLIHWGIGAITAAFLARELAASDTLRGKINYPLLGAAAYSGMAIWHGGLSGSALLDLAGDSIIPNAPTVPISDTIFSSLNLTLVLVSTSTILLVVYGLSKRAKPMPSKQSCQARSTSPEKRPLKQRLVGQLFGMGGSTAIVVGVLSSHLKVDLNTITFLFFFLAFWVQGSLSEFQKASSEGAASAAGIVIQFPLYFGIVSMLHDCGAVAAISDFATSMASQESLPVYTFFSAGFVNLLVPSGGGQWAIQGPILIDTANALNTPIESVAIAFAFGDGWTNMLQPFWALPLLGIMNLRAKDIIGATLLIWLTLGISIPLILRLFG